MKEKDRLTKKERKKEANAGKNAKQAGRKPQDADLGLVEVIIDSHVGQGASEEGLGDIQDSDPHERSDYLPLTTLGMDVGPSSSPSLPPVPSVSLGDTTNMQDQACDSDDGSDSDGNDDKLSRRALRRIKAGVAHYVAGVLKKRRRGRRDPSGIANALFGGCQEALVNEGIEMDADSNAKIHTLFIENVNAAMPHLRQPEHGSLSTSLKVVQDNVVCALLGGNIKKEGCVVKAATALGMGKKRVNALINLRERNPTDPTKWTKGMRVSKKTILTLPMVKKVVSFYKKETDPAADKKMIRQRRGTGDFVVSRPSMVHAYIYICCRIY
jgi:hypothetical protein